MTDMTFEVFCFLMLNENLLIFKFAITIPTPGSRLLLLLASHPLDYRSDFSQSAGRSLQLLRIASTNKYTRRESR